MSEAEARDAARILCALWTCGTPVSIPFGGGLLDRALEKALPWLPEGLAGVLSFDEGPEGRRCVGLEDIERAGREAGLLGVSAMAPGSGVVVMTTGEAQALLADHGMDAKSARHAGRFLFDEVTRPVARRVESETSVPSTFGI